MKKQYRLNTITAIRNEFWETHRQFRGEYKKGKKHYDYNADIRFAFNCFVDAISKNGDISDSLTYRVTL